MLFRSQKKRLEIVDGMPTAGGHSAEVKFGEEVEQTDEAVRVYDVSKSNQGVRPKTPEDRNKAAAVVKAARANKPKDNYSGKSITGAGSAGAGQRQAGKTATHIAVKEETDEQRLNMDESSINEETMEFTQEELQLIEQFIEDRKSTRLNSSH